MTSLLLLLSLSSDVGRGWGKVTWWFMLTWILLVVDALLSLSHDNSQVTTRQQTTSTGTSTSTTTSPFLDLASDRHCDTTRQRQWQQQQCHHHHYHRLNDQWRKKGLETHPSASRAQVCFFSYSTNHFLQIVYAYGTRIQQLPLPPSTTQQQCQSQQQPPPHSSWGFFYFLFLIIFDKWRRQSTECCLFTYLASLRDWGPFFFHC